MPSLLLVLIHAKPYVPKQHVVDEESTRNKATSAVAFALPPSAPASQKPKNRKRNVPALIFTLLIGVLGENLLGFITLLIGVMGRDLLEFMGGAVVFGTGGRKTSSPTIFSPLIKKKEDLAFLAIKVAQLCWKSLEEVGVERFSRSNCQETARKLL